MRSEFEPFRAAAFGGSSAHGKGHTRGTHRVQSPSETLARLKPVLADMGITRVANVTGLDHIGIPVCLACRPGSRSLAVSQGKGLDLDAARVSAIMECVEGFHGENVRLPLELASYRQLRRRRPVVDVDRLLRTVDSRFHADLPLLWVEGADWLRGKPVWVPFQMVHTNYNGTGPLRIEATSFAMSTNGLASGNHRLEAASHALCELIERDACHRLALLPEEAKQPLRLDLASVDDGDCREILGRFDRAGVAVAVWDASGPLPLPVFQCSIADREIHPAGAQAGAAGFGCHPVREIALLRALTEAAQSRLTAISGARDDIQRHSYQADPGPQPRLCPEWFGSTGSRGFHLAPTRHHDSFEADLDFLLEALNGAGFDSVILVDLTLPEFDLAVMRAIIPGAQCPEHGHARFRLARRPS